MLPAGGNGRCRHARFVRGRSCGWAESAYPEWPACLSATRDRRGAADVEDIGNSSFDTRGVHDGGHLLGDVFHVPVTFSIQRNLVLKAHVCLHYWYRGIFIRRELVAP